MLIRHAEKPVPGVSLGVDVDGRPDEESLTPKGWLRSGALACFFDPRSKSLPPGLSTPDVIFAAGVGAGSTSKRSVQTAVTVARLLEEQRSVPFITQYLKDDLDALATDVLAREGCALLVWEHKMMAELVRRLTSNAVAIDDWDPACFDRIWILVHSDAGWVFSELPQALLPGDGPLPETQCPSQGDAGSPVASAHDVALVC
jgi:hypothetical protein